MRYLLTGSSGFLGAAVRVRLAGEGHEVVRLVRREPASSSEFGWDPAAGEIDMRAFDGVDVVLNLSGAGVFGRPWTPPRRQVLQTSRTQTTGTLAAALADLARAGSAPALIQTSGIGRYGTRGGATPATEDTPAGPDFLSQLVVQWEGAADAAVEAGVRVVTLRTSPVLDRTGGAFRLMRAVWSLGGGAVLGDGRQRMPMISLRDYLRVLGWAAATPTASGPYNVTIPELTTNREFTDTLARQLGRPRFLAAPAAALRLPLGELAEQLLGDLRAVPHRLIEQGFTFVAPDVRRTVRAALESV